MIEQETEFVETVVHVNRVAKVVKGGKNFSFSAVVVAGDRAGRVGFGTGKAREVPPAIQKGVEEAKKSAIQVPLVEGTIPHEVWGRWGATKVLLKPASPGTGVIAGAGVRAVMESAGVQDILTKVVGSRNALNVVRATFNGIHSLLTDEKVRRLRGLEPVAVDQPPAAADGEAAVDTAEEQPAGDPEPTDEAEGSTADGEDEKGSE